MPLRVVVYIDGFNLYHAISDLHDPSLKWVNLWSLSESFLLPGDQLSGVKYFSAFATWMFGPYFRHRQYVKALACVGVQPILGRFKSKPRECKACGVKWTSHEEKETDVNIAIHLVQDAILNKFDRAIIVSADSDLVPAVELAKHHAPQKRIFVAAPPGRFAHARDLHPRLEIKKGRIARHLLAATVSNAAGTVQVLRPTEYDP